MKQFLSINPHSFIDVITNSSSEIFIIKEKKNLEIVESILKDMCRDWNRLALKGYFGDWNLRNKRPNLAGDKEDDEIIIKPYDEMFDGPFIYTREMYENRGLYAWDYESEENIGKILITSATDNSIPIEIMEWIENLFYVQREHLG